MRGDVGRLAKLDIAITAMALRYAEHLYSGRIIPKRLSGYYDLEPDKLDLGQRCMSFGTVVFQCLSPLAGASTSRLCGDEGSSCTAAEGRAQQ